MWDLPPQSPKVEFQSLFCVFRPTKSPPQRSQKRWWSAWKLSGMLWRIRVIMTFFPWRPYLVPPIFLPHEFMGEKYWGYQIWPPGEKCHNYSNPSQHSWQLSCWSSSFLTPLRGTFSWSKNAEKGLKFHFGGLWRQIPHFRKSSSLAYAWYVHSKIYFLWKKEITSSFFRFVGFGVPLVVEEKIMIFQI